MVTLRDIQRSVSQTIRNATADTDGQSTLDAIDAFLDEHGNMDATNANSTSATATSGHTAGTTNEAIDRLSNELFQLCNNIVLTPRIVGVVSCSGEALQVHNQHYLILLFVRKLAPVLGPDRIFNDWWESVLKPVLGTASYTDKVRREARAIVSDCLVLEDSSNSKYGKMIVDEYLGWSENYHKREEDSMEILDKPYEQDETTRLRLQHQALLDLEQDEWSKSLVAILLSFGAAETKLFFELLNEYFLQSKHRLQIVYLLSEFLLRKRTHLHEVLETELFTSMLKSMMYDNSTTLIAMSVTNLIMLLPRICTSLPPHLPQLFYIFARALCWDQLRDIRQKQSIIPPSAPTSQEDDSDDGSATPTENSRKAADGWDCADYTFSKLSAPPSNPLTGPFFTSLYGLYPCNFVKFLHAPYSYFVENDFHMPEEFDEETFRSRTLTQVSRHMLHPNLVTMDIETELTDRSRWMKMEPPDVIAQIMSLDLTNAASRVAFTSDNKQHRSGHQPDLLDEEIWAHTGQVPRPPSSSPSTAFTTEGQDHQLQQQQKQQQQQQQQQDTTTTTTPATSTAPTTDTTTERKQSGKAVNSILDMHRALKGGAEVLIGEDVWDADLERFSSPSPSASVSPLLPDPVATTAPFIADISHLPDNTASPTPSLTMSPETKLLIAALKREVLLLRNELNFELFVKQQHLQHMARLHREHVVDSSVEAERQRTYNTTRMLRAQLKDATNALTKLKAESALTKQKHIKWEDEQQGKLRSYREARKKWQADMEEAKQKLAEQERTAAEQHAQLLEAQRRVFELESELRTRQPLLEKAAENEHRVMQLTKQMLLWEEDTAHLEEQKGYIKGLLSQWWSMEELVGSLQAENQRLSKVQSELNTEKEQITAQLEQRAKKEATQQKTRAPDVNKTEKGAHKKQISQMSQTIQELKEKLENLEMEKLEWQAQLEHAAAKKSVDHPPDEQQEEPQQVKEEQKQEEEEEEEEAVVDDDTEGKEEAT